MSAKNKLTVTAEPGKQEIFMTREFDAPRELVFKAHIDPKLYVQWLGPHGYEMILETFEPVSGGKYRYVHKDKEGNEYGFHASISHILLYGKNNINVKRPDDMNNEIIKFKEERKTLKNSLNNK